MKKVSRITMFTLALSLAYSPAKAVDWEKVGVGALVVGAVATVAGITWAACAPESNDHMSVGNADYRESLKSTLYEKFAYRIEENDPEKPDFYKNMFKEALEELCSKKNNALQLLEKPVEISLSNSTLYILVKGPKNLVLVSVGYQSEKDKWGNELWIYQTDETGVMTASNFSLTIL